MEGSGGNHHGSLQTHTNTGKRGERSDHRTHTTPATQVRTLIQGWFMNCVMVILSLGSVFSSWLIRSLAVGHRHDEKLVSECLLDELKQWMSATNIHLVKRDKQVGSDHKRPVAYQ